MNETAMGEDCPLKSLVLIGDGGGNTDVKSILSHVEAWTRSNSFLVRSLPKMSSQENPLIPFLESGQCLCCAIFANHIPFFAVNDLSEIEPARIDSRDFDYNCRVVVVNDFPDVPGPVIAVTAYRGGRTRIYSVFDKRLLHTFENPMSTNFGLESLSSEMLDSSPIVLCGRVQVFNAVSGEQLLELPDAPSTVRRIKCFPKFSLTDAWVSGNSSSAECHRYDLIKGAKLGSYQEGHRYCIVSTVAVPSREAILTSGSDSRVKIWSADTYECVETLQTDKSAHAIFYNEERNLIFVGTEGRIEKFDLRMDGTTKLPSIMIGGSHVYDIDQVDENLYVSGGSSTPMALWTSTKVVRENPVSMCGVRVLRGA